VVYVALIYAGQKLMEPRKAMALDRALLLWNVGLAVFSIIGALRMTPEWAWSIFGHGNSLTYSICSASFAQGVTGFWTQAFALSKVAELIDTVFIVARKRPLLFLHWYHHVTVLVYTWHAYKDHTASGRWFIWMNYTVHAFMYSYYALRAARFSTPKWCAMAVTCLQIAQMCGGVAIAIGVARIKASGGHCQQTWENLYFSAMIYASYFLLFCNFFYHAYLKKNNRYAVGGVDKKKESSSSSNLAEANNNLVEEEKESTVVKRRAVRAS